MYRHKAPIDKAVVTNNVPIHFPKINPPTNANGLTKPRSITHKTVNRKKIDSLSANIESNVDREVVEKVSPPVENENTACDIKFTAYDRAPVNVKPVSPEYPEESRLNGVEGKVYVRAIIDINGDVACAEVIKGLSDDKVNESARDAVPASMNRSVWEARIKPLGIKSLATNVPWPGTFECNVSEVFRSPGTPGANMIWSVWLAFAATVKDCFETLNI